MPDSYGLALKGFFRASFFSRYRSEASAFVAFLFLVSPLPLHALLDVRFPFVFTPRRGLTLPTKLGELFSLFCLGEPSPYYVG